ncbi:LTA synthase family protein [Aliarcobacter butzleri]|uniref:LTA synthase family protein n=2 Tax=Aliarcobacter butzleri TaxID=28197 RepID=A0AAP4PYI0_9BACT|nr:LTA synthase family protein [Aliarcobacter butzleri]MDN5131654.1 LTA synthase family protein [Aliarcobacter butzleri]NUW26073.1 sulfatase-like hydrolase/transferase [Aliarcobacter butzleri]NUW28450.1 sulfatase-like hydrolase/transferase [Aliarcobacter butzleri]
MKLIKELFKVYLLFVALFLIGRFFFYLLYFERFNDISLFESLLTFIYGLRMDTIVICIILVIPTIFLAITPKIFSNFISKFLSIYILFFLLIALFIECASFPFFAQYDLRPNYLFIEYLEYPQEVTSLLFKDYKFQFIAVFILIIATIKIYSKSKFINFEQVFKQNYISRVLILAPILLVLFLGIRSSLGHRPVNISDALYSTNRVINEITKNSLHSLGYAYYSNKKAENNISKYGKIDIKEAYKVASLAIGIDYKDEKKPFYREVKSKLTSKKQKNLVIFIQESMGAQFTGFIGKQNFTPNLDNLAQDYLSFTNLYSNGTRSVRGLAALTSGTLPINGIEVIKRNKSQEGYFTIASLLKPYGYKSSFIYGGEARFDNMKGWYLGNGFDEIIEQKDFTNPIFTSTWGISDEDLVIKANEKFKSYYENKEKFVSVMFSSSNHMPFELPDGKIEFEKNIPKTSVENAIKYADFAIGKFFELAKKEDYFKDTVFVVIADHNVRVYGDQIVPIDMFQIPAVIVSSDIPHQIFTNLTSQADVLATALDLIGIDLSYPILGNSIFKDNKKNINLMIFDEIYAYRKEDKVAILVPNMPIKTYLYKDKKLIEIENDLVLEKEALALIYVLDDMYKNKSYK